MPNSQETTSPPKCSAGASSGQSRQPLGTNLPPKASQIPADSVQGPKSNCPCCQPLKTTTVAQHSEGKKQKKRPEAKEETAESENPKSGTQQGFVTVTKLTVSLQRDQGSDSASYTILASKDCQKYSRRDPEEAGQLIWVPVEEASLDKVVHGRGEGQSHPLPTVEVSKSFRSYSVSPHTVRPAAMLAPELLIWMTILTCLEQMEHLSSCMCVFLGVASSPRCTKASGSKWHLVGLGYIGTQKKHARIHTLQYPPGTPASMKYLCPSRLSVCIYCRVYIFLNCLHMCKTCDLFIRILSLFKVYHWLRVWALGL